MNPKAEALFNTVLEKNERFQVALKLMNENQVNYIKSLFEEIQSLKNEKEQNEKYIDIAIKHDDYEGELFYEQRACDIVNEIGYNRRLVEEYIKQVIAYES